MRIRSLAPALLLALPLFASVADAQRIPTRTRGGPARPAPVPDLPPGVAREMAYKRLPMSIETYPMVARFETDGFRGGATAWTSFGMGTRADYRVARFMSATFDMTSSIFGGPALAQTMELGTRFRPERQEHSIYPYLDLRIGYVHAFDGTLRSLDFIDPVTSPAGPNARYSHGFGTVAGAGMEIALTRTISLTTGASRLHSRMRPYGYGGVQPDDRVPYSLTSYRYTVGARWNPVRFLQGRDQTR
jgi:hypothetical protein